MIRGIDSFREWFRDYEDQYAIIGGTACDLLMTDGGLDFRATKDIDLVLIVEAVDSGFANRFWEYVVAGGYEHRNKSTGEAQFYRFTNPQSREYPNRAITYTMGSYLLECMILEVYDGKTEKDSYWVDLEFRDLLYSLSTKILYDVYDPKGIQGNLNTFSMTARQSIIP